MAIEHQVFYPSGRSRWLAFYLLGFSVIVLGVLVAGWTAWRQIQAGQGLPLWAWPVGLALLPLPWLGYGAWMLWRARYRVLPQGLEVQWGSERRVLPWERLTWAGLLHDYSTPVRLPKSWWPGIGYGLGHTQEGRVLLAYGTTFSRAVLIETEGECWLLTPARVGAFLEQVRFWVEQAEGDISEPREEEDTFQEPMQPSPGLAMEVPEAGTRQTDVPPAIVPLSVGESPEASEAPVGHSVETTAHVSVPPIAQEDGPGWAWWQRILQDRWALGLLGGNGILILVVVLLWWQWFQQGDAQAMAVAYVLMVHGWLLGLAFALGFYAYALLHRRDLTYVLWLGEFFLNVLFAFWLGLHGLL